MTLSVGLPCAEDWNNMQQLPGGQRFCAHCAHTVVDFSNATDAEIIAAFRDSAGKVCGRFRNDQLDRPLSAAVPVSDKWRYFKIMAAAGMLAVSQAPLVHAQDVVARPDTTEQTTAANAVAAPVPLPPDTLMISGVVRDEKGNPVEYATVFLLENEDVMTFSDENGQFELTIPEQLKGQAVTLLIEYGIYSTQQFKINPVQLPWHREINLVVSIEMDGYTYTVGGASPLFDYSVNPLATYSHAKARAKRNLANRLTSGITGRVTGADNQPLNNARIQVVNTRLDISASVNSKGQFILAVPDSYTKNYCKLVIKCEGYAPVKKWVNLAKAPEMLEVRMVPQQ